MLLLPVDGSEGRVEKLQGLLGTLFDLYRQKLPSTGGLQTDLVQPILQICLQLIKVLRLRLILIHLFEELDHDINLGVDWLRVALYQSHDVVDGVFRGLLTRHLGILLDLRQFLLLANLNTGIGFRTGFRRGHSCSRFSDKPTSCLELDLSELLFHQLLSILFYQILIRAATISFLPFLPSLLEFGDDCLEFPRLLLQRRGLLLMPEGGIPPPRLHALRCRPQMMRYRASI